MCMILCKSWNIGVQTPQNLTQRSSSQLLTSQPPQHNYFALSKYFIINNCFHLYYSSLNVYWINPNLSMHTYRVKVVFINQLFCKLLIIKYISFYSCDRKICFKTSDKSKNKTDKIVNLIGLLTFRFLYRKKWGVLWY